MKKAFKKFKRQISGGERKTGTSNKLNKLQRASSIDVLDACDNDDEREVDMLLSDGHDINDLFLGKISIQKVMKVLSKKLPEITSRVVNHLFIVRYKEKVFIAK